MQKLWSANRLPAHQIHITKPYISRRIAGCVLFLIVERRLRPVNLIRPITAPRHQALKAEGCARCECFRRTVHKVSFLFELFFVGNISLNQKIIGLTLSITCKRSDGICRHTYLQSLDGRARWLPNATAGENPLTKQQIRSKLPIENLPGGS
jgi:hypothetical protein